MDEAEFAELIRRVMASRCFESADGAVIILFRTIDESTIGTWATGYFDMDRVEDLIEAGQEALEDMRDMKNAEPMVQQ